jgi:hypothetical protein
MRLAVVGIALLIIPTVAAAQRRPDSVSLRFKWPTGTTAQVEQKWIRVDSSPERRDSITVRSRYRMRVLQHAEGQLIATDSFVVSGASSFPDSSARGDLLQAVTRLGSFQPSFIVSAEGEFQRVEGIAQAKPVLDSVMGPRVGNLDDVPPGERASLRSMTSEQALLAAAERQWSAVVGAWVGADWVVGEAYERTIEEPVPFAPGMKIPMRYEYGAVERLACTPAMRRDSCVRLELYREPDAAALRKLIAEMMTRLGVAGKEILEGLQELRTINELRLIAEPRTLRPHSVTHVTRVRRVDAAAEPGGTEKGATTTRVDIRTARYRYAP